uniref:Ubiquitin-like domain-containing protein n=1 Tax=Oryza meridionalis TaxID=40149 RepID=A0A0E0EZ98_9ORYZ
MIRRCTSSSASVSTAASRKKKMYVHVKTLMERTLAIEVEPSIHTVKSLKKKIQDKEGIIRISGYNMLERSWRRTVVTRWPTTSIVYIRFRLLSCINCNARDHYSDQDAKHIEMQRLDEKHQTPTRADHHLGDYRDEVRLSDTVKILKEKIQDKEGIMRSDFWLQHAGKKLEEDGDRTLANYAGKKLEEDGGRTLPSSTIGKTIFGLLYSISKPNPLSRYFACLSLTS